MTSTTRGPLPKTALPSRTEAPLPVLTGSGLLGRVEQHSPDRSARSALAAPSAASVPSAIAAPSAAGLASTGGGQ
ncbi:hypothetical protein [Streptomyces venezuelae]|uniref:hypothetical protein n=1 Tax=Streptomyces venezuelae TaxID=54571 RepID=UPI00364D52D0